jgi:hypothetical protein
VRVSTTSSTRSGLGAGGAIASTDSAADFSRWVAAIREAMTSAGIPKRTHPSTTADPSGALETVLIRKRARPPHPRWDEVVEQPTEYANRGGETLYETSRLMMNRVPPAAKSSP